MQKVDIRIILKDSTNMEDLDKGSIDLVVTSPPYPMVEMWDNLFHSVGANTYDEMHNYLAKTWTECFRVLKKGGLMCINIGDATRSIDHRFKLYPNHSRITEKCEQIGFETLPYILWQKPTNKPNAFLGSGLLPPNAYVTLDCEYILIFRKDGLRKFEPKHEGRYNSAFTKEERDVWFSQIWHVKGERQNEEGYEERTASFPTEIPRRLIRMFSIEGDTVLDPFLGTGTTALIAKELNRNCVGYEVNAELLPVIKRKVGTNQISLDSSNVNANLIIEPSLP
jgi:site-specific DNA-methyltransferase (cytosine-N4-specific)